MFDKIFGPLSGMCSICLLLGVLTVPSSLFAQSCLTSECHVELGQLADTHAPVAEGECSACHEQVNEQHPVAAGQKSFQLVATDAQLCYQCHETYGRKLFQHAPVKDGACTDCHNPHGAAKGRALLGVDHDLTEVCLVCHDAEPFSGKYVHGPSASGACTSCHDPHEANQQKLMLMAPQEACTGCHEEMAAGMAGAKYIHSAVEETSCEGCHNPHSSPAPKLLQKDVEKLCLDCHQYVGRNAKKSKVKHAALYREEKCSACHSSHFSEFPALLFAAEKDVCLSCHGVDNFSKSKPLKNIAKDIEGKMSLHGPLADGKCSGCHNPHGSDYFRMLIGNYPSGFYQPYRKGDYDFCLECHDKDMLRFEKTSIYTDFRNGKQNLHFLHVANKFKGRSCRVCHEAHASDGEKLISVEGAKFGDWQVPTRFVKSDTGGSCSPGCHRTYDYDREDPVSYEK